MPSNDKFLLTIYELSLSNVLVSVANIYIFHLGHTRSFVFDSHIHTQSIIVGNDEQAEIQGATNG